MSTEASTIPLLVWNIHPPSSIEGSEIMFIFESIPYSYVIFGKISLTNATDCGLTRILTFGSLLEIVLRTSTIVLTKT